MRFAQPFRFVSLLAACGLLGPVALGCSSSSGSSGVPFVPGFGTGATGDGGTSAAHDAGPGFVPVDSGQTGVRDTGTTVVDTGVQPPPKDSSTAPPALVPSTGITLTVIPDDTDAALIAAINGAKSAVHVEMYLLTNSTYINALINQKKAGVDVKVILNQTFPTGTSSAQTNSSSYSTLQSGGVSVVWAPADPVAGSTGYTHEKTVIIDPGQSAQQAWIMTMNLDPSAPKDNREYLARDTSAADVAEAEAIFQGDFAGAPITPSGDLVVAPHATPYGAADILLQLVESATTSIDMEAEEIDDVGSSSEAKIYSILAAKAQAGVKVQIVLEDSTNTSQSTAVTGLQSAGAKVVGYVYGSGINIHAKALVVDGARAYVGSENFTGGSLEYNRELGVYFTDATSVGKLQSTIQADFAGGSAYAP